MVSRFLLDGVLRLLRVLGSLVELVQILAGGQVALHAVADDMMALGFVLGGSMLALVRLR